MHAASSLHGTEKQDGESSPALQSTFNLCFSYKTRAARYLLHLLLPLSAMQDTTEDAKAVWDGTLQLLLLFYNKHVSKGRWKAILQPWRLQYKNKSRYISDPFIPPQYPSSSHVWMLLHSHSTSFQLSPPSINMAYAARHSFRRKRHLQLLRWIIPNVRGTLWS